MISPAIATSNHAPLAWRENIEFQLGKDVERLAAEAGSVALILAEATSQGAVWTKGTEEEVGTTYETIPLRDGQVTVANVVATGQVRSQEARYRDEASMGISTTNAHTSRGGSALSVSTIYWREGNKAASITIRKEGKGKTRFSVHGTSNVADMRPGADLPAVTNNKSALEIVRRGLRVTAALRNHVPPRVLAAYNRSESIL